LYLILGRSKWPVANTRGDQTNRKTGKTGKTEKTEKTEPRKKTD
jgi:hypothetical protein